MPSATGEKLKPSAIVDLLSLSSATANLHIIHKTFTLIYDLLFLEVFTNPIIRHIQE